jgi:hypothetical protein
LDSGEQQLDAGAGETSDRRRQDRAKRLADDHRRSGIPDPLLHMLLAAFITTAMCITAAGAWYLLRDIHRTEAQAMMRWAWASPP